MIVSTVSRSTEFPGFLEVSVFVAIYARISDISSDASDDFYPSNLRRWISLTYRKGSLTPPISYSGVYPDVSRFFKILTI